eukprot:CCRYP_016344-RA/>CCRYP_016344-RA protein AED:0.28 eAED:0.28 QI:89/1/1/1/0/0/2/71/59
MRSHITYSVEITIQRSIFFDFQHIFLVTAATLFVGQNRSVFVITVNIIKVRSFDIIFII